MILVQYNLLGRPFHRHPAVNHFWGPFSLVIFSGLVFLGQLWTSALAKTLAAVAAAVAALSAQVAAAAVQQAGDGADSGALRTAEAVTVTYRGDGHCDSFAATAPTGRRIRGHFLFGFPAVSVAAGATGF